MFKFTVILALCLVAGSQARPEPLVRGIFGAASNVVRSATGIVAGVAEGAGQAVGEVVDTASGIVEGVVGGVVGGDFGGQDSPAESLADAADALKQIAQQGPAQPQITIQQVQQSDI